MTAGTVRLLLEIGQKAYNRDRLPSRTPGGQPCTAANRLIGSGTASRRCFAPSAIPARLAVRPVIHRVDAPFVDSLELAIALAGAERQGRIPVGQAAVLWADVLTAPPRLFPSGALVPRAIAISSAVRIGVYDRLYVALAEREGCELVTADDRLVRNLRPRFPFVASLASLP